MSLSAEEHLTPTERRLAGGGTVSPAEVEAVMAMTNPDLTARSSAVPSAYDTIYTWDYEKGARPALDRLYEKAKQSQWNASTDLDWSIPVDEERIAAELAKAAPANGWIMQQATRPGGPLARWEHEQFVALEMELQSWRLSQFMHGEQGALMCTARIAETVPWYDAKLYASTQVMDEARHVEVFARYLSEKLSGWYPINVHLKALLDDIVRDHRWDMTYLGMQVMVEGLALAAFGFLHMLVEEPLLKNLLRYVMSDEARHVAFGVLSLKEAYEGMTQAEIRERQEFAYEASIRMRDRFLAQEVWERLGVDVREMVRIQLALPNELKDFQRLLFSKIVPNCKKLGLLDAGDGWLRQRWTEMGVIEYEDWANTGDEYLALDHVAADRAEGALAG